MKKHKKGFTLAEVLITLAVIGIVAALTIPLLIENYQKEATVEKLKKTYSVLAQAINLAVNDYGEFSTWDTSLSNINFVNKYIVPYLNTSKVCNGSNSAECYYSGTFLNGGTSYEFWDTSKAIFYLNDGVAVSIILQSSGTTMKIIIDVNGANKPNVFSKDTFYYEYRTTRPKLFPAGGAYSREYNLSTNNGNCCNIADTGAYCAAVIMDDSWKISSDYPW